jgi:hypothetical protein
LPLAALVDRCEQIVLALEGEHACLAVTPEVATVRHVLANPDEVVHHRIVQSAAHGERVGADRL